MSPEWRQAIIWTDGILLIGTFFIQENAFENVVSEMPFCLCLNVLRIEICHLCVAWRHILTVAILIVAPVCREEEWLFSNGCQATTDQVGSSPVSLSQCVF